ncbi:YaaR family protein [Tepidibacillus sp. LV47]|uniref:YaaR family protein n=1 Tax=Tepidibacillus sp. LV47 TaxID=3398228 RepID=UPI003AAFC3D4
MKIQQGMKTIQSYRMVERNPIGSTEITKFSDILSQASLKRTKEKLEQLLIQIDEQGKKLAVTRNLQDLKKYKELIKTFIDETVHSGLELDNQHHFDRYGRGKKYKVIRQIDQKLIDLTNLIMDKEQKQIDLLDQIGEMKGLLINLYF